jgi:hypothetical protein
VRDGLFRCGMLTEEYTEELSFLPLCYITISVNAIFRLSVVTYTERNNFQTVVAALRFVQSRTVSFLVRGVAEPSVQYNAVPLQLVILAVGGVVKQRLRPGTGCTVTAPPRHPILDPLDAALGLHRGLVLS